MNQRRHLLLLVNKLEIGGAERQLVELARAIDRRRFETTVMTLYPGGALDADVEAAGLRLVTLDRRGKYDFGAIGRLAAFLQRERVDIIQPFLTPSTLFGLSAGLIARTPVTVVTERCGVRANLGAGSRAYMAVEDQLTRFAAAVVPNSGAGVDYLRARGIDQARVRLIYNGVNPARISTTAAEVEAARREFGLSPETPVVGIIASLEAAKDHRTFLQAAAFISAARPETRFLVAGDGSLRGELEAQAAALGLQARVLFTGNRPRVAPLLSLFSVAVLSSRDHEGCSNFILEAMGMAKPVVATSIGGNPELVRHGVTGFLTPAGDAAAMAQQIVRLLSDQPAAERMGRAGRQRFEESFSLQRMVGAYEDLYDELWLRAAPRLRLRVSEVPR
jgi:glycosyltransferase involved in cell wall biosynthesis